MAYNGFLVKVGTYTIPVNYLSARSYKAKLETMDLDDYRDANGELHRSALGHRIPTVEFQIVKTDGKTVNELFRNISAQYINQNEKRVQATVFVPELCDYVSQDMYLPTLELTIATVNEEEIMYEPFTITMIGY